MTTDLFAQVANDECSTAIELMDVDSWCSENAAFTLEGATPSTIPGATCFSAQSVGDVWFSFVATRTVVTIGVNGNTTDIPGGTLTMPVVTLYETDCTDFTELQCAFDIQGRNAIQRSHPGLIPGRRYYIRVDGQTADDLGSFQLCVNNFNPVAEPGQDCFSGALLCDKASFSVESATGAGSDLTELDDATCVHEIQTSGIEQQSTWFTWVADNNGSIEFTLTPLNSGDDLDFFLYELPNGQNDCSGKILLRCESAGLTAGIPIEEQTQCTGPTGLRSGSSDFGETPGCDDGQDNFLAPLVLEEGKTYALAVNNFSESGAGFSVEFGGDGEFRGPEPAFSVAPASQCLGQIINFNDASTFADGDIVRWGWFFGDNASQVMATGPGPHSITFDQPGMQRVLLEVETDAGCIITLEQDFEVNLCCQSFNAITQVSNIQNAQCGDTNEGAISLAVTSNNPPFEYRWEDGSTGTAIADLFAGDYRVTVNDQFCDTVFTFPVNAPPLITATTDITMPNCGASDGALTVTAGGGTPGYEYNIDHTGFGANNTFSGLSSDTYEIIIRDQIGCDDTLDIDVFELQLELVPNEDNVTMPTCNGFTDGMIVVNVANGQGPFQYDFNNTGFSNSNMTTGPAGSYIVDVTDGNACTGQFMFEMMDHPPVELEIQKMDISCNGEADGMAEAILTGGVGDFLFQWSNGATTSLINDLVEGTYDFVGMDGNGCEVTDQIIIDEPSAIGVQVDDIDDVICFGDATGSITVSPIGGSGSFEYSIDNVNYFPVTTFGGLPAGDYTVYIRDVNDCISTSEATVDQPEELLVDIGPDQTIDFAFSTTINSSFSPTSQTVTYTWIPTGEGGVGDTPSILVAPFVTTDYILQITDQDGCTASDTATIFVNDLRPVFIPNAISPNNDGSNDRLSVFANIAAVSVDELQVYDRWGGLVYLGENLPLNDHSVGWDGTFNGRAVNSGVFVYFAKIRFIDDQVRVFKGDVVVVR